MERAPPCPTVSAIERGASRGALAQLSGFMYLPSSSKSKHPGATIWIEHKTFDLELQALRFGARYLPRTFLLSTIYLGTTVTQLAGQLLVYDAEGPRR